MNKNKIFAIFILFALLITCTGVAFASSDIGDSDMNQISTDDGDFDDLGIDDSDIDDDLDDDDLDDEDDSDDEDWDDEDEDYEEGFDFGDPDTTIYEVECACGSIINFDEETLEEGSIICPECGETLEFSLDDEDEE